MNLFKRKQKKAHQPHLLAAKAAGRLDLLQTWTAGWLNGKTANLSARGKWLFLITVCLLFGGCSLYLLISAFS